MKPNWLAFTREAASAAEHLAAGTTLLGRANYAHDAYYTQAFFSLSIGFERCAKLALLLDHALDHDGDFPAASALRAYGHNLLELFDRLEKIATARTFGIERPSASIHAAILETLSNFANNVTRYYNIDVLTGNPRVADADPIGRWHATVTEPVIEAHLSQRRRDQIELRARALDSMIGDRVIVRYRTEGGEDILNVSGAALQTALVDAARPWERMYVLQLARFATRVVVELGERALGRSMRVPYLIEFFGIFNNADAMFRSRKTWTIYE